MEMQIFKVLIVSAIVLTSWANAGQFFGQTKPGSGKLVENNTRMTAPTYVTFNLESNYKVTIDKVDLEFFSGGASCSLVAGGPFSSGMSILVSPTDYSRKQGTSVKVIVWGRWNAAKQQIPKEAISFAKQT